MVKNFKTEAKTKTVKIKFTIFNFEIELQDFKNEVRVELGGP